MCETSGSIELGPIVTGAALGVGGLLTIGAVTMAATATVTALDVFVTTFADTVWTGFLVPGAWSIAIGAPVALLASLALTWRHRTKTRPATPVSPVLEPVPGAEPASPAEDDDRCWQCPVRAVPRGMLDAGQIEASGTYVTDPDFELEGAAL